MTIQHTIIYVSPCAKELKLSRDKFIDCSYILHQCCSHKDALQYIGSADVSQFRISEQDRDNMMSSLAVRLPECVGKAYCIFIKHGCTGFNMFVMCDISETEYNSFILEQEQCLLLHADELYQRKVKDHEIYVIVGRADELESELNEDIRVACIKAGFNQTSTNDIMQKCNCIDERCIEIEERSNNTLLRIIMLPTVEEFDIFMKKAIFQCCGRLSLSIIYCGHGTEAGNMCLFDDDYSGAELGSLLSATDPSILPADLTFYFNCCYAVNVMAKMLGENVLQKLSDLAPLILGNAGTVNEIMKAYYGDQEANARIQVHLINRLASRSFFHMTLKNGKCMYLIPLSVGVLKAEGLIHVAFNVNSTAAQGEQTAVKSFRANRYQMVEYKQELRDLFPVPPNPLKQLHSNEMPKITVFGANSGDSALFSWKYWNILIDGGFDFTFDKPPCFREKVLTLNKLDLVVLTHGDCDHVNGLLPFFKKMADDKNDGNGTFVTLAAFLHYENVMPTGKSTNPSAKRGWSRACELYKYAKTAGIKCLSESDPWSSSSQDEQHTLRVKFIHPPPGDRLDEALEKLKTASIRNLINQTSLVVYIECQVGGECKHRFLFTGDADGKDVVIALKKHSLHDKVFSYVDMPHHGSKNNHPKEFLETIKANRIGVSTNGKYDHPSNETITLLSEYMKKKKKCHLHFNYPQHISKRKEWDDRKVSTLIKDFPGRFHIPSANETSIVIDCLLPDC